MIPIVPDWTDESYYPVNYSEGTKLDDLDIGELSQLAWQFLRRNPKYQEDYYKYFNSQFPDRGFEQLGGIEEDIEEGRIPMYPYYICTPSALPNETEQQYTKRMFGNKWRMMSRSAFICEKYGLNRVPPDPKIDRPNISFRSSSGISLQVTRTGNLELLGSWKLEQTSDIFMKFDMNIPAAILAKRAKKLLKKQQRQLKSRGLCNPLITRIQVELLPLYLRVLDAQIHGVNSPSKIARIVFPKKDNSYPLPSEIDKIENALNKANSLRDGNYKYFLTRK